MTKFTGRGLQIRCLTDDSLIVEGFLTSIVIFGVKETGGEAVGIKNRPLVLGYVSFSIHGKEPERFLNLAARDGFCLWDIQKKEDCHQARILGKNTGIYVFPPEKPR